MNSIPSDAVFRQDIVARLAYFYWERRGRPLGSPEQDWFRAESELRTFYETGRLASSCLDFIYQT